MHTRIMLLVLLVGIWAIQGVRAQDDPRRDDPYVNDLAEVLSPEEEESLRELVADVAPEFDLTILTINSVAEYDEDATLESYATALFNEWGIGSLPENNGVLILLAVEDREVRIELGDGYGTRYDDIAKAVIDESMVPYFRSVDYTIGLKKGVKRLYQDITGERLGGMAALLAETYEGLGQTLRDVLSIYSLALPD